MNYSIGLLFRCTKRKYAEQFQKGIIYFGTPREWIAIEKSGKKGQGDLLEGTVATLKKGEMFCGKDTNVHDLERFDYENYSFYRRNDVLDKRCLCLYGVNTIAFDRVRADDGKIRSSYIVPKEYFKDFAENNSREQYKETQSAEQPVVIFIKNAAVFFSRITNRLKELGVKDEEILIAPVTYLDKYKETIINTRFPGELLFKDKSFQSQNEVRIIINSESDQLKQNLAEYNGCIDIGPINDIAEISDYYFDDLVLEKRGNTGVMYNLPEPKTMNIEELDFLQLYNLMWNILNQNVTLENVPKECRTWQEKLSTIIKLIERKYGVVTFVDEDKHISFCNMSDELRDLFDRSEKDNIEATRLISSIEERIVCNELDEAISICTMHYENPVLKGIAYYWSGIIYKQQKEYDKAGQFFWKSFSNDYKRIESLNGIAEILFDQGEYNDAIDVYYMIQDEKGYDCKIYGNIGLCYERLNEYEKALQYFDKAIKEDPTDAFAYYNKGVVFYKEKKYGLAEHFISKAINLEPNNEMYKSEYERGFGEKHKAKK